MSDEYIRKQDAIDVAREDGKKIPTLAIRIMHDIKAMPPADVVPVVRCRDCKHWQTDWNPSIPDRHYCAVMDSMMKADDFCSYGERREE